MQNTTLRRYRPENDTDNSGISETYLNAVRESLEAWEIFSAISGGDIEYPDKMDPILVKMIGGKRCDASERMGFFSMFENMVNKFVESSAIKLEDAHIKSMANDFGGDLFY